MATRKVSTRAAQTIRTPADDEVRAGDLLPGSEVDAEEDAIAELRGLGASDEYKFTVSRISSTPGKPAGYCATYGAGDLSLDAIRESFGGGKYRIRVTDAQGKYVNNRTVEIVELPKRDVATAVAAAAIQPDMQGIASLISALRPTAPPAGDSSVAVLMPLLIAMMQNQSESLKAILSANRGPSITELLALVQSNKGEGGEGGAVSMLLKGLELGKELGGGDTGMLDVAKEGLGVLSALIPQQTAQQAAPMLPRQQRPAMLPNHAGDSATPATAQPAAVAAAAQPAGVQNVGMMQKINWLKQQVNALLVQAQRGKSAELYAEVMLDNLPPFIKPGELLERLQQPDAVQQLALLDARVSQHEDWFEEFRQQAIDFLTGEGGEEEEDEQQQPGSAPLGDPSLIGDVDDGP